MKFAIEFHDDKMNPAVSTVIIIGVLVVNAFDGGLEADPIPLGVSVVVAFLVATVLTGFRFGIE